MTAPSVNNNVLFDLPLCLCQSCEGYPSHSKGIWDPKQDVSSTTWTEHTDTRRSVEFSSLLQNTKDLFLFQFLFSKLCLVKITPFLANHRKFVVFSGILKRQISCEALMLIFARILYMEITVNSLLFLRAKGTYLVQLLVKPFFFFSSMNNSIDGARAVLVNRSQNSSEPQKTGSHITPCRAPGRHEAR